MTPSSAARWAEAAACRARTTAPRVGPVLRHAASGQVRLWKWPALLALRVPAVLVLPALVTLAPAVVLWSTFVRPLPSPVPPGLELLAVTAATAVGVGLLAAGPLPAPVDDRWFAEGRLVAALLEAEVLPQPRKGDPAPCLSRLGQPQHTDRGTSVVLALPAGRTAADVAAAHLRLSGSLHIPPDQLRIAHIEGKPALRT